MGIRYSLWRRSLCQRIIYIPGLILAGLAAGLRSIDVSPDLISTITDAVLDEVAEWHMQAMSAPRYLQVKLADVTTPA